MKRIDKCFAVNGGIIAIIEPQEGETSDMRKISAYLGVEEGGLAVLLGDYTIPLPEGLLDYITENRLITIYQLNGDHYLHRPTVTIELEKEILVEAKAVYRYHKSRINEPGRVGEAGAIISTGH